MKFGDIERLAKIFRENKLSELELTDFWGRKIRLSAAEVRRPEAAPAIEAARTAVPVEPKPEPAAAKKNGVPIKSPIVGTFYRSPAPDAPPYVEIGDVVKPGQVVCIVEAMKLMNEIESDIAGKVIEVLVKNEDPVEYNQDLFLIEPS